MRAAHTDKVFLIYCEYKNHNSKENNSTIICNILNHSQENFVIEIKQISWSCPDPIFFQKQISKSNPDPKNCNHPAGYPILILCMLASALQCMTRPLEQRLFHTFTIDVNYIASFKCLQKVFLGLCWCQIPKQWNLKILILIQKLEWNRSTDPIRFFKMCWILPDSSPEIWCQVKFLTSAEFLTCDCFSVILLLKIKKWSLAITFMMCAV